MLFVKYLLGTIFICLLLTQTSYLAAVFFVIWGVVMLLSALTLPRHQVIILFAASLAIVILGMGFYAAYYLASLGLAVLVMCMLITGQKDYYLIRGGGMIAAVIGVSLYLGSIYFITGSIGTEEWYMELNRSFQNYIPIYEQYGILDQLAAQGVTKEALQADLRNLAQQAAQFLPSIYYLQALLTVFFMLLIASNMSLRSPNHRLNRRPYFLDIMPWQLVWLVIIALALWLWGRYGQPLAYRVGANIIVTMVPVAGYFGFSAISWGIKKLKVGVRKWVAALLIILSLFLLPSAIIFLALTGLFDALVDYRKLRSGKGEET